MSIKRKIVSIQSPPAQQGFLGAGHTARAVIQRSFSESDPFILLMDDVLDKQDDDPAGGPHPHGGFETVTLVLEGEIGDQASKMKAGDFQVMTAGSGIIHAETIEKKARMRILQLWLTLPKEQRWVKPRVQDLPWKNVAGVSSPVSNYVPLVVADIRMKPNVATIQHIPASFTVFLYVLEGSVATGEDNQVISQHAVGWLDKYPGKASSELQLTAGPSGARVILYAAQPQGDPVISRGPFIGDQQADITRLYNEYSQGKMQNIASVAGSQRIKL